MEWRSPFMSQPQRINTNHNIADESGEAWVSIHCCDHLWINYEPAIIETDEVAKEIILELFVLLNILYLKAIIKSTMNQIYLIDTFPIFVTISFDHYQS